MQLDDKVAVITGGGGGIGRVVAGAYVAHGARVVVSGRSADSLDSVVSELGGAALAVTGDVTDQDDLVRLFEQTDERFGTVDVLVANAGGINFTPLGETSESDFDAASDLNFKSVFFTVQAALPYLSDGASIIITGNALSSSPVVGPSVAIAAKAAARALARTFAVELAPRRIRVNVVSPGPTASAAPVPAGAAETVSDPITERIPLGRWGEPQDVAGAAVFLASDESSFITGADLPVGGGIDLGWVPSA